MLVAYHSFKLKQETNEPQFSGEIKTRSESDMHDGFDFLLRQILYNGPMVVHVVASCIIITRLKITEHIICTFG